MNDANNNRSMRATVGVVIVLLLMLGTPARAADPIFPIGSRLGLVPPAGMVPNRNFEGFADVEKNAAILFSTLPAAAYDQLDKSMVPDAMQKQGIDVDKREPITLSIGKGFILSGKQTIKNAHYRKWLLVVAAGDMTALVTVQIPEQDSSYSEKAVRDALATLTARASVPDAERLSQLPFTVGNLAGFQIEDVLPGRALMLVDRATDNGKDHSTDPSKDTSKDLTAGHSKDASPGKAGAPLNARLLVAAMPGGPSETDNRDNFARGMFDQIVGIKDVRIQDAEPLRIGNQSGYQTLAKAKDARDDIDVMVVQWLRFGSGGFMQMIGIARADMWPDMFTRLRTVRDSVD
jgi:hypothetical protein